MDIQYLGHSSFLIKNKQTRILIDPFINNKSTDPQFKRQVEHAIDKDKLKNIDLVLITHEHFDHFDKELVEHFAKRDKSLVVGHESFLKDLDLPPSQIIKVFIGQKLLLRKAEIEVTPAHHPSAFYPVGYKIGLDDKNIYHMGDTTLTESINNVNADVLLVPIGGERIMDVVDAVRITKAIKPNIAIPMSYNTFPFLKADPKEFQQKIEKSILKTKPVILKPGKSFKY